MMKRSGNYGNNNNKNRFQQAGGGGQQRPHYRKGGGGNHNNNNAQFADVQGDGDQVHPRQRRHLQAQKDRYIASARDALGRGDRILAEFYYQHVEHYSRMIGLIPVPQHQPRPQDNQHPQNTQQSQNESNESDSNDGEDHGESDTPLPTRYGGGPSSFYTQPAQTPQPAQNPQDDRRDEDNEGNY